MPPVPLPALAAPEPSGGRQATRINDGGQQDAQSRSREGQPLPAAELRQRERHEQRQRAARECRFDRRLHLFSLLLHGAAQAAALSAWSSLPAAERAQRLLSVALVAAYWVLPAVTPVAYLRWRTQALVALRLAFFAFPLLRKARGIQKVLDSPPQPGVRGALLDLFKVVWGSRLIAVAMAALVNPLPMLPLLPHLAVQLYSVAMVRRNSSLCRAPLLAHPLTAARIRTFHHAMQLLANLLPGVASDVYPLRLSQRGGGAQATADCEAFLTFLFACVGLLLPMLLVLRTERPDSLARWEAARLSQARQPGCAQRLHDRAWQQACAAGAAVEAAARMLCGRSWLAAPAAAPLPPGPGAGSTTAPTQRQQQAGRAPGPGRELPAPVLEVWARERAVAWWLLLSLIWALSVLAASSAAHPPASSPAAGTL